MAMPSYNGYDANVNPTIDLFFATTGFRYGHSEVLEILPRLDINRNPIPSGNIDLKYEPITTSSTLHWAQ